MIGEKDTSEILAIILKLKEAGATKVHVGDISVEFEPQTFDPIALMEKAEADVKEEFLSKMSDEEKVQFQKKLKNDLLYGSS